MTLDRFIKIGYKEDEARIGRLKEILRDLGVECARIIEEKVDLQFPALEYLHGNLNDDETFIRLVIANALVSYQLTATGEEWWREFSEYFSRNPAGDSIKDAYAKFLPNSRTNRRFIQGKLKRLERIEPFLQELKLREIEHYYMNMSEFRNALAEALGAKKNTKTVVFAVKMFGYACRIALGRFIPYPMDVEIPDDVRINAYTKRFTDAPPVVFWSRIAGEVAIPPLHIDSILWPVLGKHRAVMERLKKHCPKAQLVLELREI
ncbi:N-glycosylase/DNA lyase [Thermococcus sp.]